MSKMTRCEAINHLKMRISNEKPEFFKESQEALKVLTEGEGLIEGLHKLIEKEKPINLSYSYSSYLAEEIFEVHIGGQVFSGDTLKSAIRSAVKEAQGGR